MATIFLGEEVTVDSSVRYFSVSGGALRVIQQEIGKV